MADKKEKEMMTCKTLCRSSQPGEGRRDGENRHPSAQPTHPTELPCVPALDRV